MIRKSLRLAAILLLLAGGGTVAGTGPVSAQSTCGSSVVVGYGDTLHRIASRCGVSISALLRANPQITNPNIIVRGSRLHVPGASGPSRPRQPDTTPADQYRVRPGDTLSSIARRYGVSLSSLIAANRDVDPRALRVGTILRIPGAGSGGDRGGDGRDRIVNIAGTLTREGVECQALRGDDGRLYTLTGDLEGFGPGDRVEVRGQRVGASICQQGTTLEVHRIRSAGPDEDEGVRVTGTLTNEGVECQALRGDNGRLYTLTGDLEGFGPGDRVTVSGMPAEVSFCMQGRTIAVERIRAAR